MNVTNNNDKQVTSFSAIINDAPSGRRHITGVAHAALHVRYYCAPTEAHTVLSFEYKQAIDEHILVN